MEKITKNCRGVKQCNNGINRMKKEKQRTSFRAALGLKEHKIMNTEEYSVTSKIKEMFQNEKIKQQHKILNHYVDLYFPEHRLAIKIDEKGHFDNKEEEEKEREDKIKKKLVANLLGLIQAKKILIFLLNLAKYRITLLNQIKIS